MSTINILGNGLSGSIGSGSFIGGGNTNTYTPTMSFATAGNLTVTYIAREGFYSETGNLVHVSFYIDFRPTFTTSSGDLYIGSLPVTSVNNANYTATGAFNVGGISFPSGSTYIVGVVGANTTNVTFEANGTGAGTVFVTSSNLTSGSTYLISGSITYLSA